MTVLFSRIIRQQPLILFSMVTYGFVNWRSNSLFPNWKNLDIFIEKNLLLNWPRSTLYDFLLSPDFFGLAKTLFEKYVVE